MLEFAVHRVLRESGGQILAYVLCDGGIWGGERERERQRERDRQTDRQKQRNRERDREERQRIGEKGKCTELTRTHSSQKPLGTQKFGHLCIAIQNMHKTKQHIF